MDMMTNWEIAENHEQTKKTIAKTNELLNRYTVAQTPKVEQLANYGTGVLGKREFKVTVVTTVKAGLKENAGLIGLMRKNGYKAIRCRFGDGYGYRISKETSFIIDDPDLNQ